MCHNLTTFVKYGSLRFCLHLKDKGSTASPYLYPLFALNSGYKCLPILTLAFISIFKILHYLTIV